MIFKCKMCGAALEVGENATVAVCEYCESKQTLPKLTDEKKANLYDRANHFRRNNDYDKAMGIYEQILSEDNTDAEDYWSLILCKYGIEYVEDPATRRRVPTVNRAQFTSVLADADYKSAIEYADAGQRTVYEAEAKAIDEIQKGILAISQKEKPFDVFICYKETDSQGRRTLDSVLATELYHGLTNEGFKVFFSRITLEDKLGTAYEPYIFAALNSAKVMVVLGTNPEYFNAVWVKNEWKRYLALIKKGEKKILIPAYKDMDPYDLPEEFSHLQAQDMSKLGFMQDLIRGIKKIAQVDTPKATVVKETVISGGNANTAPLLKRAFMFLEDGDWNSANEYCEKVLDIEPENAQAYLGKLMVELRVTRMDDLKKRTRPFDSSNNYQKVLRFGDENLTSTLKGYIEHINTAAKEKIYSEALKQMNGAATPKLCISAAEAFESISGYKDSKTLAKKCHEKAEYLRLEGIYIDAKNKSNVARTPEDYKRAAELFNSIPGYKDSAALARVCFEKAETVRKDTILADAKAKMEAGRYETAISQFHTIAGWRDADSSVALCYEKIEEIKNEKARRGRITKITVAAVSASVIAIIVFGMFLNDSIILNVSYNQAISLMEEGEYHKAIAVFENLRGFRKSKEKIIECEKEIIEYEYNEAVAFMHDGKYQKAVVVFEKLNGYKESEEKIKECYNAIKERDYKKAIELAEKKNYVEAAIAFGKLGNFNDSEEKAQIFWDNLATREAFCVGKWHCAGVKADGTVVAVGSNNAGRCDVSGWTDVIAVSVGNAHTVGLKSDGTVVAVGYNDDGQCNVSGWTDIVAISAGGCHTVGLKSDGSVVVTMNNNYTQSFKVSEWRDIIAVSAGEHYIIGLKIDGTVVAAGADLDGECKVSDWTDIVAISAGYQHTVGLKSDGTVVAAGDIYYGQRKVSDWTDIVAISAGDYHTVGLKSDGTVVAVGDNEHGQCDVSAWSDIVAISAGTYLTVGLKSDGTVVAVGDNGYGECDVVGWNNIKLP